MKLRQAKNELERKVQDQEEELDEQAGTIQQLEQVACLHFDEIRLEIFIEDILYLCFYLIWLSVYLLIICSRLPQEIVKLNDDEAHHDDQEIEH